MFFRNTYVMLNLALMAKSKFLLDERTGGMSAAMIDSDYPRRTRWSIRHTLSTFWERERVSATRIWREKMAEASDIESSQPSV